jgi:hypothetical protein
MNGTDQPPSTTGPTRPLRARRALMMGLAGLTAIAGSIGFAGTTAGTPIDLTTASAADVAAEERSARADATTTTSPLATVSTLAEDLQDQITALAATAAFSADVSGSAEPGEADPEPTVTTAAPPTTAAPTTTAPPPTTAAPQPAPEPQPASTYGDPYDPATWDRLAGCESGGNWHIDTGNGYYGGLQFSLQSWQGVGGTGYPHEHSREHQIQMGIRLWEVQGWGAWPGCSRKLGYR